MGLSRWDERILVVAPHADDETVGCGGLMALKADSKKMVVVFDPYHYNQIGPAREVASLLGFEIRFFRFGANGLEREIVRHMVDAAEAVVSEFGPTSIFLPYPSHHQDHRLVYETTVSAVRENRSVMLAMYEYPYIADRSQAFWAGKFWLDISGEPMEKKCQALKSYPRIPLAGKLASRQAVHDWAMARGAEIGVDAAEVFYLMRGTL